MDRSLISNLRLSNLHRFYKKNLVKNKSLKNNTKRLFIILLIFLSLFILLLYRSIDEVIHDIGDANTLLEPMLFIILFIIFLFYLKKKK
jgi:ABC-type Na+ efflux pump permease subunit